MAEHVEIKITAKIVKARGEWTYRALRWIGRLPWWMVVIFCVECAVVAWFVMAAALSEAAK